MSLFEALSLAGVVIGAAWGLIERHSALQGKVEEAKIDGTAQAINRLERLVDKLTDRVDAFDSRWASQFALLNEKVNNLKVTLASVGKATLDASSNIDGTFKNFTHALDKIIEKSSVKELGNGYQRVESKKKTEGSDS